MKFNKLKSIFLSSALALSLLFTGCSNNAQTSVQTQSEVKGSVSSNIENTTNSIPKDSVKATVERVIDGDTVKLKIDNNKEAITLRLLLVDTPESVKKGVDPQPYSLEASNFAKNTLLAGDTVYIEYDDGDKTDKYDRHLGYLWYYSKTNSKWEMFNEKLIAKGYARVGYVYSQKRHLDEFYKAQDYAKANKLNIWSVDGYVTDKGYDVNAYNSNKGSNSSSNKSDSSSTVYANSNSKKYHSSKNAHNMKDAIKMSEKEAKSKGYVPCGTCY